MEGRLTQPGYNDFHFFRRISFSHLIRLDFLQKSSQIRCDLYLMFQLSPGIIIGLCREVKQTQFIFQILLILKHSFI